MRVLRAEVYCEPSLLYTVTRLITDNKHARSDSYTATSPAPRNYRHMNLTDGQKQAVRDLDWKALESAVDGLGPAGDAEWEGLIDAILRGGHLINRRPDAGQMKARQAFMDEMGASLRRRGLGELVTSREHRINSVEVTEKAYQAIMRSLDDEVLCRMPESDLAWASIRAAENGFRHMMEQMQGDLQERDVVIDPITMKLGGEGEAAANPDTVHSRLQSNLTATLKRSLIDPGGSMARAICCFPLLRRPASTRMQWLTEHSSWRRYGARSSEARGDAATSVAPCDSLLPAPTQIL